MSKKRQGTKVVSAMYGGREGETRDTISVAAFDEEIEVANVSIKKGLTINLGDYNSARIDVMVNLPCYVEEIETAAILAAEICDAELEDKSEGLRALHKRVMENQ